MRTTKPSKTSLGSSASWSRNGATPALELEGVVKRYGATEVLEPLSFSVEPGESVAIAGPSGAGKSTLLRLIAGSLAPDDGTVLLHGQPVADMEPGPELSRLVGMIAQQYDLVPNLSALHNVLAGRLGRWGFWTSLRSLLFPSDCSLAMATLQRFGIADRAPFRASNLSGGEQQRVAIARVLVQDPAIVVADEPVSSLDPARAGEVTRLLVDITSESRKTLIASIHAVELAREHFSRVIGLRNGAVQFDAPGPEVTDGMLRSLYALQGLRGEA